MRRGTSGSKNASDRLRVGIAGAGAMARQHLKVIGRLRSRADVVALADPDPEARRLAAEPYPDVREFDRLEEMLEQASLDVVHVCTPPDTHDALARVSLQAGCHVYVEKPLALSVDDARSLVTLAEAEQHLICCGHQLLFSRPSRAAERLMGALGRIVHVESFFSFRQVRRAIGGRPASAEEQLVDILPHPVYLLVRFLELGSPIGTTEAIHAELGAGGTIHALLRRGELTGSLVVSLTARPIENYVRVTGSNGSVLADFVRGSTQSLVGPGTSAIDKLLNPYRLVRQLTFGTTSALFGRFLVHRTGYPGLEELVTEFYAAVEGERPPPLTPAHLVETVDICERLSRVGYKASVPATVSRDKLRGEVVVTGGTGFLGTRIVRGLVSEGWGVRVLARRRPPPWTAVPGATYLEADLGDSVSTDLLQGVVAVVHCAAETAGGWEEHERNSVQATRHVLEAAAAAGVSRVVHVSSLAVLADQRGRPLAEDDPLRSGRGAGPYVWGKAEAERLALELGAELDLELCIVRPGALVDFGEFQPPGRLGRRVGNLFVAVGSPSDPLEIMDVDVAAQVIGQLAVSPPADLPVLNLVQPEPPPKRELISRLKAQNPQLRVIWLPRLLLVPMSLFARALQRLARPSRVPIDVAAIFAPRRCDTRRIAELLDSSGAREKQPRPESVPA